MHKVLNKFLIAGCLFSFLLCPCFAIGEKDTIPVAREIVNSNGQTMELIQNEVNVKDLDIDPLDTKDVKNSVVPDAKKESKKVAMLFIKTMLGVMFSAIVLYIILLFVNKFYKSAFIENSTDEYENLDLATPQTKQDALKSFLNRVK